ncbi:c-type cytochrome biogenesis protein CcmI [Roseinatronobacter alkalisoli]|uniref:C-type cytochrome biogenesis protein CcmI n=1 Tax=Roseinatronobacter alkalisoli TaxID=3028235 RepID=A0ABT5T370_9RHOB|nr:c-type cytochrome biogenesis protein CcmI [Roseinatronobacter sp. HJB301]MDD7969551.1 c-type cytochrome biogenesis protein CcmI [Roseinatronobacter sp. HJB301]
MRLYIGGHMAGIGQIAGFVVIGVMVAAVLLRAVMRARVGRAADGTERAMRVYRDQLREVERDIARGTLSENEAERLRLEIQRRVLDLDKGGRSAGVPSSTRAHAVMVGVIAVLLSGGAVLYMQYGAFGYPDQPLAARHAEAAATRANRPAQAEFEAEFAAVMPDAPEFEDRAELEPMVAQLRAALVSRPDDAHGFSLLAQNESRLGNFAAAAQAQARVIAIRGDDAGVQDHAFLLDLLVLAAGGMVSPEAEKVIEHILRRDPMNGVALYYTGRMYVQTGRPDLTFRVWRRLHDQSVGDAPWMSEIRAMLPELSRISGEPRYQLPPRPAPASARGPVAADIDAAMDLSPEERAQMIEDMVASLSARLANDGGSAEDWAQLVRALAVLEQRDQALAILQEARTVFAARAEDLALLNRVAEEAGLSAEAP